jgi:hypothetical protein
MLSEPTNLGFVEHCEMALEQQWGYVRGTFGQILTDGLLEYKLTQYSSNILPYYNFIKKEYIGKRTTDCSGLIKSYLWWNNGDVDYDAFTDFSANDFYVKAEERGFIDSIPHIPGICVWKNNHVGVYIGEGSVIEAKGTMHGVVRTPLKGAGATKWTNWFKCHSIKYINPPKNYEEIIKECTSSFDDWLIGIKDLVDMANAGKNIGSLKIFRYLPELIQKIYNR